MKVLHVPQYVQQELRPRYADTVLGAEFLLPNDGWYVHLQGPRTAYADLVQRARAVVPHLPIRYTRTPFKEGWSIVEVSPKIVLPKKSWKDWLGWLSIIGALFFILGLVVYHTAVS